MLHSKVEHRNICYVPTSAARKLDGDLGSEIAAGAVSSLSLYARLRHQLECIIARMLFIDPGYLPSQIQLSMDAIGGINNSVMR